MSNNRGEIRREIFIAAPREVVFDFLVDPLLMVAWIGISHNLDPRPGGIFRVEVSVGNVARGRYVEVSPPRRVAFTWGWETRDSGSAVLQELPQELPPERSLVEIDLESAEGGTVLHLRHSGLPGTLSKVHGERWMHYLDRLDGAARDTASGQVLVS
jgi:uncharacterized protein YndB with AHSA1/START domain